MKQTTQPSLLKILALALSILSAFPFTSKSFAAAQPTQPSAADLEFFEKSVRPLLEEKCVECHSASKGKTKGGLALDSAAGLRKGGTSGSILEPGLPDKSLLINAVRYKDPDLQMPPEGKKLSPEQITILEDWVRRGAPDPREGKAPGADPEQAKKHWAYQPLQSPNLPPVRNTSWAKSPVDRFILARLESKDLSPSPEADRATLIRRISFDLTGLPPTPEELHNFLSDSTPQAFEKLVDRLLASPRFGERWGRHWLDIARYSDTKGLPAPINADRRFHFAYSYRDYVIDSFNQDKPFNQFVIEQLAADYLTKTPNDPSLAALGFLTVGRCFQNQIHEIIDDRIDVVTRGLMGISVACARCHDHKFDPISTKDYYALHGVFSSCEEPKERPTIGLLKDSPETQKYLAKREELLRKIDEGIAEVVRKDINEIAAKTGDYFMASLEKQSEAELKDLQTFAGERKLVALPLYRWVKTLKSAPANDPILRPWKELSTLPTPQFAQKTKELSETWAADPSNPINPILLKAILKTPPDSPRKLADIYSKIFGEMAKAWEETKKLDAGKSAPTALPEPAMESLRLFVFQEGAPCFMTQKEAEGVFGRKIFETRSKLQDKVNELDGIDPGAPARAMVLVDKPTPVEPVVFIRGNPGNRGPKVPRKFISFLSDPDTKPFAKGSGRLELAEAIVHPKNPLTARVLVNRIWLQLFTRGLVQTPNDFGVQTSAPSHPELLDYLASQFIQNGWSLKTAIREIVLSNTYRQSSKPRPEAAKADAGNDLLYAQRRKRLDYESMQDSLLLISGCLDETRGGRAVELTKAPFPGRRSVYGYIDRQDLPSVLQNFDFANPDITTGQRFATTVPQQALFLMNSELIDSRAKSLVNLPEIQAAPVGPERIQALFQRVYQRRATTSELTACQSMIQPFGEDPLKPWQALAQTLLLSNETFFVD